MSKRSIIRAWKDREYRDSLTEDQRAHLPANPAGLVDLSLAELEAVEGGMMGWKTQSVDWCAQNSVAPMCPITISPF